LQRKTGLKFLFTAKETWLGPADLAPVDNLRIDRGEQYNMIFQWCGARDAGVLATSPGPVSPAKLMKLIKTENLSQNLFIHPNATAHDLTVFSVKTVVRALTFTDELWSGMSKFTTGPS
jgi:hypothetical protein